MTNPKAPSSAPLKPDQTCVRIGTRGSPLALVQARLVAAAVEANSGGKLSAEIVTFTTSGDQLTTERLINSGGKGLFTKEIDLAVSDGRVDIAVHSLKDVPSILPDGQVFYAYPKREDPREGFLSSKATCLADLPKGATVGTASLRREAQTLAARPDLNIVTFRGRVETRMQKLEDGLADATYLAMAGLTRLGMAHFAHPIPVEDMLPAAAQGIIGVVGLESLPAPIKAALEQLDHADTRAAATAERAFLLALDGSCRTPIAAHLFDQGETWRLKGEVIAIDGSTSWQAEATLPKTATEAALAQMGREVGDDIREQAGGDLPAFQDDE